MKENSFNELELFDDTKHNIDDMEEKKRVELCAMEFDWIFEGDGAISFMKRLANTDNDDLFAIPTIKIIIMFMWQKYFYKIRNKIFLPYIAYMTFLVVYATHIYEQKQMYPNEHWIYCLDIWFASMVLLGIAFFLGLELNQIYKQKLSYFTSFWSYLDLSSIGLNLAFVIYDLT